MLKRINYGQILTGIIWIIVGLIFDAIIQVVGVMVPKTFGKLSGLGPNSLPSLAIEIIVIVLLATLAMWVLVKWGIRPVSPKFGLHQFKWEKLRYVLWGYLAIIGISMVINLIQVLVNGKVHVAQNQQLLETLAKQGPNRLIFVLTLAVLVAPFIEETIFRGIILNYFFKKSNWWINVILSGGLFGYFHLMGYDSFDIFAFLQYSVMGIVLAIVYKKTKQIQYSISLHLLNNAIGAISIIAMAMNTK